MPLGIAVNFSRGTPSHSPTLNAATTALVKTGVFVAAAAGNDAVPAADNSPTSPEGVCVVSGVEKGDTWHSGYAFGERVDLLAPAVDVSTIFPGGRFCHDSGTSFAAPVVAGLAAYFMGLGHAAEGLCGFLKEIALKDRIGGVPEGTPNLLVNNGYAAQVNLNSSMAGWSDESLLCPSFIQRNIGSFTAQAETGDAQSTGLGNHRQSQAI